MTGSEQAGRQRRASHDRHLSRHSRVKGMKTLGLNVTARGKPLSRTAAAACISASRGSAAVVASTSCGQRARQAGLTTVGDTAAGTGTRSACCSPSFASPWRPGTHPRANAAGRCLHDAHSEPAVLPLLLPLAEAVAAARPLPMAMVAAVAVEGLQHVPPCHCKHSDRQSPTRLCSTTLPRPLRRARAATQLRLCREVQSE